MRFAAILVVLFAASAYSNIIDDVFGDVFQKQVALFKEIVAQVQSGADPLAIIKGTVSKFPHTFDNFDLLERVCGNPAVTKFDFAVKACNFIKAEKKRIQDFIASHRQKRNIISDVFGDVYEKQVALFKEIVAQIQAGGDPLAIIKNVVSKFPHTFDNFDLIERVCSNAAVTKFDFAVKACTFIKAEKKRIQDFIASHRQKRNIIGDVFGDIFNKEVALFKDIVAQIQSGANPLAIIKNVITKFPQAFDNFDLINRACGSSAVQAFPIAKTACGFIQQYHQQIHDIIGLNKVPQTRGIFSEVFDNFITTQVAFFKQIAERVAKGDSPLVIIKDVAGKFPDTFKNFDLLKTVCENSAVAKIDFAQQACTFIRAQEAKIKEILGGLIGKRGFFEDVFGDLVSQELALFKEIEAQIKSGASIADIIKNAVTKFPEPLKKFDLIKAVCANPTVQAFGISKLACKFVQDNVAAIEKVIGDLIAPVKGDILDAINEFKDEFAPEIKALQDIYNQLVSGKDPVDIVQQIVSKYTKEIPAIKAACAYPLAQRIPFVAEACKFLGAHASKLNRAIEIQCGETEEADEQVPLQRSIVSDILNQYKQQIDIIKNIADQIKGGKRPIDIIAAFVKDHVKEVPLIKEICTNPIATKFDFVQQGCAFINANKQSFNRAFFEDCADGFSPVPIDTEA